jgi:hypothetical protein
MGAIRVLESGFRYGAGDMPHILRMCTRTTRDTVAITCH